MLTSPVLQIRRCMNLRSSGVRVLRPTSQLWTAVEKSERKGMASKGASQPGSRGSAPAVLAPMSPLAAVPAAVVAVICADATGGAPSTLRS